MAWRTGLIMAALWMPLGVAGAGDLAPPVVTETAVHALPHPYDEAADAKLAVNDAIVAARAAGKPVLLDFGANWCPDCRALAGIMALDAVRPWLEAHYTVVSVDVGRFNKNLDIAKAYGVTVKAIPTVVVVGSDGRVANADEVAALGDARTMSPQQVVDLLAHWAPGSHTNAS